MRWLSCLLLLCLFSCKSVTETEKLQQSLAGDWIILYPDHKLNDAREREVYSKMQDSIVGLSGLKLVTLSDNGDFRQLDSLEAKGKWGITPEKVVFINNGGKGFDNYSARFTGYEKEVLKLTEFIESKGEKIKLVWHLKKIEGRTASELFSKKSNAWRNAPAQQESPQDMKERLSVMLKYYSDYYYLVNKESSYFIPSRIILPFKFYQHAVGLKPFKTETAFTRLFYDTLQAKEAYQYLDRTMNSLSDQFPASGSNYVEEYAEFLALMATGIMNLK